MAATTDGSSDGGLTARLNYLFEHVRPEGEDRRYSGRELVAAVNEADVELSESYLSQLRRGMTGNPTLRVLKGIADFFGVRVGYLLDDPEAVRAVEAQISLRAAMRDAQVQDVAYRAAALNASQRVAFDELLTDLIQKRSRTKESSSADDV
ncbi:helix-turn-helix domain-containing protein [Pseudonocardia sp. ICBG1293]|uniref:helix-turn-helix domain-containing protein n=1 Tax=Pseudonocardia sp. ICBG1293 TaxID=2844382 RepID=UPI001CCCA9DC|nr:helix-turn-helix transcriptional regulator [Pseudonocardia sp. ICBG1293]